MMPSSLDSSSSSFQSAAHLSVSVLRSNLLCCTFHCPNKPPELPSGSGLTCADMAACHLAGGPQAALPMGRRRALVAWWDPHLPWLILIHQGCCSVSLYEAPCIFLPLNRGCRSTLFITNLSCPCSRIDTVKNLT